LEKACTVCEAGMEQDDETIIVNGLCYAKMNN